MYYYLPSFHNINTIGCINTEKYLAEREGEIASINLGKEENHILHKDSKACQIGTITSLYHGSEDIQYRAQLLDCCFSSLSLSEYTQSVDLAPFVSPSVTYSRFCFWTYLLYLRYRF
jgi:hypothetical protein